MIRQFVAMPLGGGYTAEEQVTGTAAYGGLQILVHPMRRDVFERRFPERPEVVYAEASEDVAYSAPASPDMGLAPGGRMRQEIFEDPLPAENRVRRDDAGDLHPDAPSKLLAAHGESTALGIGQAKRPRVQVLPEDPILLPEIRDQIVLVAVHPASERENEKLSRRRHGLR